MQNTKGLNTRKGLVKTVPRWDTLDNVPSYQSAYQANGFEPVVNMDFANNILSHELTNTRTSNSTMTDSDGIVKWAPHNLVSYSEDFANAYWTNTELVITTAISDGPYPNTLCDRIVADVSANGATGIKRLWNTTDLSPNIPGNTDITVGCYFKTGTANPILAGLTNSGELISVEFSTPTVTGVEGSVVAANGTSRYSITKITPGISNANTWYYCTMTYNVGPSSANPINVGLYVRYLTNWSTSSTSTGFRAFGYTVYRSDLMNANSTYGTPYIKSTSSPKFGARIGHYVDGINKGLLIESSARANSVFPSADFLASGYIRSGIDITKDGTISPIGKPDASKLTVTSTSPSLTAIKSISTTSNLAYSLFVKRGNFDYDNGLGIGIYDNTAGVDLGFISFDFSTETVSSTTPNLNPQVEKFANGWYRIGGLFPNTAGNSIKLSVGINGASVPGRFLYIYGVQLESVGISMYIPTFTASVIRTADTLTQVSLQGIDTSDGFSTAIEGDVRYWKTTGTTTQVIMLKIAEPGGAYLNYRISTSGALQGAPVAITGYNAATQNPGTFTDQFQSNVNNYYNFAGSLINNRIKAAVRNNQNQSNSANTITSLFSNTYIELGSAYNGTIQKLRLWPIDIQSSGIASIVYS